MEVREVADDCKRRPEKTSGLSGLAPNHFQQPVLSDDRRSGYTFRRHPEPALDPDAAVFERSAGLYRLGGCRHDNRYTPIGDCLEKLSNLGKSHAKCHFDLVGVPRNGPPPSPDFL